MEITTTLGRSDLHVPRLGVGAMTWGDARGLARLQPAQTAYGPAHGYEEEKRALEVSLAAGVNLFDTAAMYSLGAAERRLGELARGRDVIIATKYPSGFSFRAEDFPQELERTLARLGREDEARTHLRIAAALDPASATYRKALDRIEPPAG